MGVISGTVTRKEMEDSGATKRGLIAKLLKGLASAIVRRVDIQNYWGNDNTVNFTCSFTGSVTGEIKGIIN